MFLAIFFIGFLAVHAEYDQSDLTIKTLSGSVRGSFLKTRKNQTILSFRGIKYAEPPTGVKRFRPPLPVKPWSDIYDATEYGPVCPQPNPRNADIMSEDCLVLNVHTKNLTGNEPVLVYIHGGGFRTGSGHSKYVAGPQYLLDHNIVFVSINYRLGALGFLSTGTKEATGNYGFKDQVLALKWVKNNIRVFGGNPNLVTIWGQSAGSMSVSLHMVSPMSRGLFHRAIAMSGTSMSHISINNTFWTQNLLKKVNCMKTYTNDMMDCLRAIPYEEIISACESFDFPENITSVKWNYEIEAESGDSEPFLIENPTKSLIEGNFSRVPVIVGITKDEFGAMAQSIYRSPSLLKVFNENFDEVAPFYFSYENGTKRSKIISSTLRSFYLNDSNISDDNIKCLEDLCSDSYISHGVHRFVSIASKFVNVFYYHQNYIGRFSYFYGPDGKPHGVMHTDDLQYLMLSNRLGPMFNLTDPENIMVERMTSWWTWFAKTGQPNNALNPWTSTQKWIPSDKENLLIFNINTECTTSDDPNKNRFSVWDQLYPIF